jgi:hypothetical protein
MNHCTKCYKDLSVNTALDGDHQPREKDISVCLYCGNVAIFQKDMTLRDMTSEEWEQVQPVSWSMIRRTQREIANKIKMS